MTGRKRRARLSLGRFPRSNIGEAIGRNAASNKAPVARLIDASARAFSPSPAKFFAARLWHFLVTPPADAVFD